MNNFTCNSTTSDNNNGTGCTNQLSPASSYISSLSAINPLPLSLSSMAHSDHHLPVESTLPSLDCSMDTSARFASLLQPTHPSNNSLHLLHSQPTVSSLSSSSSSSVLPMSSTSHKYSNGSTVSQANLLTNGTFLHHFFHPVDQ